MGSMAAKTGPKAPKVQTDLRGDQRPGYMRHGSEQHAALLGLRRAGADDVPELDGWTLADITAYGPAARPEFVEQVLRQKVMALNSAVPKPQSDDPGAPDYAPPMFVPPGGGADGIV